jgi:hypothetical protein
MFKLAITFLLMYVFGISKYLAIRVMSIACFFTLMYLTLCMLSFQ